MSLISNRLYLELREDVDRIRQRLKSFIQFQQWITPIFAEEAYGPITIMTGSTVDTTIDVPGVQMGMWPYASYSEDLQRLDMKAVINEDGKVMVTIGNFTGNDVSLAGGTIYLRIEKRPA